MNKKYIIVFVVIVFSLSLPFMTMSIEDYFTLHHDVSIKDTQTQEILKNHPLITRLNNQYFSGVDIQFEYYNIKNKHTYNTKEIDIINKYQKIYETEINQLIKHQVITPQLLEITDDFKLKFGTLAVDEQKYVMLDQIYRMWDNQNFKSISYTLDSSTHQIKNICITQQKKLLYTEEQIKEICMNMIKYLGFDDIDDWNYNQNGYESLKAKIRVECQNYYNEGTYQLEISVKLLGIKSYKQIDLDK